MAIVSENIKLSIHLKILLSISIIKLSVNTILYISDKTVKKEGKSSPLSIITATICQTDISIKIEIIEYFLFFNEY